MVATRKQCQHPITWLCSSPASQAAASSSGWRAQLAGLRLNPPVRTAGHESPLVGWGIRTEKAFISQSRLLFCRLLAANHGRKHHDFFHLLLCFQRSSFQCNQECVRTKKMRYQCWPLWITRHQQHCLIFHTTNLFESETSLNPMEQEAWSSRD